MDHFLIRIPVYNIHDVIEPFGCKNDLKKCGEFYLIETVLENFKTPIKIEAGFYSSNLVYYLVNTLNMPLTQIKYMILTKRALKPNTFKPFIEHLFDEFPESEAKRLANSFIGELGRKYNKPTQDLHVQITIQRCVVGQERWLTKET